MFPGILLMLKIDILFILLIVKDHFHKCMYLYYSV